MSKINKRNFKKKVVKEQPRKDNRAKRVNFDNTRTSKFDRDVKEMMDATASNDIKWYSKSPARLESAGRIPFASITGLTTVGSNTSSVMLTVPGIMAIRYAPNFVSNQKVVEQAYQSMYSNIVHANSRNQSYDYTDLAIMHQAGVEIFSAIAYGIRAYGLMRQYDEQNVYTPERLVSASGFDSNDLRKSYSHMWEDLLMLIAQSRQIWLPNDMPILERRMWMNLNIYKDSESIKGQYYMYVPHRFYKYQGYTDKRGGKIVALEKTNNNLKWNDYVSMVQEMIDAIVPDQDRGIMFGDILKAYGKEGIFAINEIDLQYRTLVVYNPEVLWQIENLTLGQGYPIEFYQDSLHLYQHYTAKKAMATSAKWDTTNIPSAIPEQVMMNFHQSENPTAEQLMIATRMSVSGVYTVPNYTFNTTTKSWEQDSSNLAIIPEVSGTEIPIQMHVYYNTWQKTDGYVMNGGQVEYVSSTSIPPMDVFKWMTFDWSPAVYVFKTDTNKAITSQVETYVALMEYDNYTLLHKNELQALHNVAIYSLYNVPFLS